MNIIEACISSLTMVEAAKKMNMPFSTFRLKAQKLGVYKPNKYPKSDKLDKQIIIVCKNSTSMYAAANKIGLSMGTFKKHAERLGVYKTNQGLKGIHRPYNGKDKILLSEILKGLHPTYQTNKLRIRLINEGLKKEQCEKCKIIEWLGERVSFELNHIDGDKKNHLWKNLEILCPNCHSQTSTYRGRNIKKKLVP